MGRKSLTRELAVWVNGIRAATWRIPPRGGEEFQYEPAWVESEEGRPLSLSLPFSLDNAPIKGPSVNCYFDNLLPDSDPIRQRIQRRFRTESRSAFDLLVAVGRDCAGAVQLVPKDETPARTDSIAVQPLTDEEVERALINTTSNAPLRQLEDAEFRISLAGAQEKSAFVYHEGRWCRPLGSTPTTHIFKLPLGLIGGRRADMTLSVENEWLCARILRAFGLPIPDTTIGRFGSQKVLIVERFDRQLHPSRKYWLRLVQEDFCQALGVPSAKKYEADGGPGVLDIAKILRGSVARQEDLETFFKAQLVLWMLAACDGHAKNFSLRILSQGRYRLTPLYDVISYWPIVGNRGSHVSYHDLRMAMAVLGKNKHYKIAGIQRRHFVETAARMGIGAAADSLIQDMLDRTNGVISEVQKDLPAEFPQGVLDAVLKGLKDAAARLENRSTAALGQSTKKRKESQSKRTSQRARAPR